MDIAQRLKEIIIKITMQDINIDNINASTILTTDLGYNSVQIIELIVELENEFNIEIDDDDLDIENLTVFNKLHEMVRRKQNNKEDT